MLGNPSPLADLLDSVLQLVSLEEDDEDGLVDLVSLWGHCTVKTESDRSHDSDDAVKKIFCTDCGGVLQWVFDVCLSQEHVSSANPPQHPLKRGNPLSADDSGHKPEKS